MLFPITSVHLFERESNFSIPPKNIFLHLKNVHQLLPSSIFQHFFVNILSLSLFCKEFYHSAMLDFFNIVVSVIIVAFS